MSGQEQYDCGADPSSVLPLRCVSQIITGPGFMTRRFRSFLVELKRVLAMLFGKLEPVPPYAEYLQAALRDNMYKKVRCTSLWSASCRVLTVSVLVHDRSQSLRRC